MTDWNFDDENIDPSMGDEYGFWPGTSDESDREWFNGHEVHYYQDDEIDEVDATTYDHEDYEEPSSQTERVTASSKNEDSERVHPGILIHSLWSESNYDSARELIADYLRDMSFSHPSRPYYLRLVLASFFSAPTLDSEGLRKCWIMFESFMKMSNLPVSKNEVNETRSKLRGLVVGFYADALDSDIQLAAALRNEFRRADLALVILKRHAVNGVLNTPYFNNTLLATLIDLKMFDEAKPVYENLEKYAPLVPGSIERVLTTQCRYLLELFVSTGDLDYLDEAGQIIDRMPGSGVEQSFYLKCLARYLSLRGENAKSAEVYEESQQVEQARERALAPSTLKLLQNQTSGNLDTDLGELVMSPIKSHSEIVNHEKSIDELLNEMGFSNVNIESDQRANAKNWFFHTIIQMECSTGSHNRLHVFRSHYEGVRLEAAYSAHYFAVYCSGCNLVSFTRFQDQKFKQYNNRLRSATENAAPIKEVCPTCHKILLNR